MGRRRGFGLWLQPITQAQGWTRETFAFALAVQNLSWGAFGIFAGIGNNHPNMDLISLGGMLLLGRFVLSQIAYFSMASSLKRDLASRGVKLEIGGITLFFFTLFYLQSNLSWTARWKQTGQTKPEPSKGMLWLIFFVLPFVLGILLGLGITAYQEHVRQTSLGDASVSSAQIVVSTK